MVKHCRKQHVTDNYETNTDTLNSRYLRTLETHEKNCEEMCTVSDAVVGVEQHRPAVEVYLVHKRRSKVAEASRRSHRMVPAAR